MLAAGLPPHSAQSTVRRGRSARISLSESLSSVVPQEESRGAAWRAARRGFRRPLRVLARRARRELQTEVERVRARRRAVRFDDAALLARVGAPSIDALWSRISARPYVSPIPGSAWCGEGLDDAERVLAAAEDAVRGVVTLLGSEPLDLARPIDWHRDQRADKQWAARFSGRMRYVDQHDDSDVKIPWEISRLQWALPIGQAYQLTGAEHLAETVRKILEDWIDENPYAFSINWVVTMEVALRVITWSWLFRAFSRSTAWQDVSFRSRFLRTIFLHADFIERNLERSEVNGNHYTANAAGLVFAGLFFGDCRPAERWGDLGWRILREELLRQVYPDGVDFEMSSAYHRLGTELFLLPALYREAAGLDVPQGYRDRVTAMAVFAGCYTKPDGSVPLWGDADDARVLPLGSQGVNDHRYLAGLVASAWGDVELRRSFSGPRDEVLWLLGPAAAASLPDSHRPPSMRPSRAFPAAGVYVMSGERDHVFIDCGPVGLAGRGGHGHNDCLSMEVFLDGVSLITDSGSYVYTASFAWRNRFRATSAHNTAVVDREEQNRFEHDRLWSLEYDARPSLRLWRSGSDCDVFAGSHSGYERLPDPVTPVRTVVLDKVRHRLAVRDEFLGRAEHEFRLPYHFATDVEAEEERPGRWLLTAPSGRFVLSFRPQDGWQPTLRTSWVSPSYGVKHERLCLELAHVGTPIPLVVAVTAVDEMEDALAWAQQALELAA